MRVTAGILSIVWAAAILPPQVLDWAGRGGSVWWAVAMYDGLGYRSLVRGLASVGLGDTYLVFGVAIVPTMLLVWWATRPALLALGWSGAVLSWGWFGLAPVTAISYLNHADDAPLRAIWGAEGFWLMALFLWGIVVAIVAPRRRGIPVWVRIVVGATVLFGIGGTLLGGYYPHGTMIGIGVQAVILALWAPVGRVAVPGSAAELAEEPQPVG